MYSTTLIYVVPFQSKLSQAVTSSDDVELLLIVKFNVAVESQPIALVVTNVYVPLSVYVVRHSNQNYHKLLHLLHDIELILIVKFKVAVEEQPDSLVTQKYKYHFQYK